MKRRDYAALGILEYWRFNQVGCSRAARLAGDRLVNDAYEPLPIDDLAEDILQGHSAALNLNLRWEQGQLGLYIPATGRHIATFAGERARADREQAARSKAEAQARINETALTGSRRLEHKPKPASVYWKQCSANCITRNPSFRPDTRFAVAGERFYHYSVALDFPPRAWYPTKGILDARNER